MGSGKQRWRISFHKSPIKVKHPPKEFICPISGSLMADPIIVSSGHTFERHSVLACKSLSFTPILPDNSIPNFSTIIPNRALKSTILNWCSSSHFDPPTPLDFISAENIVRTLMATQNTNNTKNCDVMNRFIESVTLLNRQISTTSEESVTPTSGPTTPLTRPLCYSSASSSEMAPSNTNSCEEDELIVKLKSSHVFEQEEAVISLRKLTRTREETRFQLCTPRLLSALRSVISSRYASVQVNSIAALVNLSLENGNRVKIVRSGIVPPLIDVLKGGFPESQEHAAGALFSLALDDQNKTAIGVLGALPPLLHSLRSESERTRHDSALALYHLSLVQSNRSKLVKLGAVQSLLGMVRTGHMTGRILSILCNMAASLEGRGSMLDGGAVECFVGMLRQGEFDAESIRESCVTALYGLSHGGLRFKGLAKEAAAEDLLITLEGILESEKAKDKVRKILEVLREKDEEEEEIDWEELLNSDGDTNSS
ncbi:PREDICTED: U-box domain-containing protein 40-like [Nicotiana attenuata]|uniref:RING-type E3 ubiquitin transferase n=1 Tax=Nicotiana attenuata TaxID=49451 RepID=A0A314KXE3_NICAT|nr:PREDICTED: U-box domain-containing protein 40-like [Nicotiana attenuata]OIT33667.1 u-box domain-containing protein 40 [Nicotiana attenuata]